MEDMAIVLYCTEEHLNSMLLLAIFIEKHHQTRANPLSIIIISTAPDPFVVSSSSQVVSSSITYCRLPTITLPPNAPTDIVELFFEIPRLQNPNLRIALEEIISKNTKIDAFIIDFFCNSAFEVSKSMNIPTYFYFSNGASNLCVGLYLPTIDETIVEDIGDLNDYIQVPGCPPVYSLDFPSNFLFRKNNATKNLLCMAKNVRKSSGVIVHSFDALEFRAKEALSNGLCNPDGNTPPVYFMGPLLEEIEKSSEVEHECLKWLDSQPCKSVVFLCFGRRGSFSALQLAEIATGLEKSGHRFLWSVKGNSNLLEGFMERTKERGFVVKNWAPQKKVLSHGAVGGFVTHCGWSSIIESVSFGVPMIGWPLYAEQKMNRVFMVEEMKVALSLEMDLEGFVTAVELEKQVKELMESNLKGRAIRSRVAEMKIAAEAATRKGGSSLIALEKFIKSNQP